MENKCFGVFKIFSATGNEELIFLVLDCYQRVIFPLKLIVLFYWVLYFSFLVYQIFFSVVLNLNTKNDCWGCSRIDSIIELIKQGFSEISCEGAAFRQSLFAMFKTTRTRQFWA